MNRRNALRAGGLTAAGAWLGPGCRAPYVAPRSGHDLQAELDWLLARGDGLIRVPPGDWRLTPREGIHLRLHDLRDTWIDFSGVRLICTETTRALDIRGCTNTTIRGLTIDYDPLPTTQFVVTRVADDTRSFEMEMPDGYEMHEIDDLQLPHVMLIDPATGLLRVIYGAPDRIESLGGRRYRYTKVPAYRFDPDRPLERAGDIAIVNNRNAPGGTVNHAVLVGDCARLTLEDVHIHASNFMAVFEGGCDGVTYRRVVVDRCPPDRDLKPRGAPRFRSSNRDAFHLLGNRGRTVLDGCVGRYADDDGVNVHGSANIVTGSAGVKLRLLDKAGGLNVRAGDRAELIGLNGIRLGRAEVAGIERADPPLADELAFWKRHLPRLPLPAKAWIATLNRPLPVARGAMIYCPDRVGSDCLIRACRFGRGRSRGIVLRASRSLVESTVIEGNWQKGIMVTGEFGSLEGGFPSDVTIRGNDIASLRHEAVDVAYMTPDSQPAGPSLFENIQLIDNRLDGRTVDLRLVGVAGVVLRGNTSPGRLPRVERINCERVELDLER